MAIDTDHDGPSAPSMIARNLVLRAGADWVSASLSRSPPNPLKASQVMAPWSTEKVAAITPIMRTNLVWKSRSRAGASSSPEAYPATTPIPDEARARKASDLSSLVDLRVIMP